MFFFFFFFFFFQFDVEGINPNRQQSYKGYLQNTPHVVLCNRPTLVSIATEGSRGVQLGTLA